MSKQLSGSAPAEWLRSTDVAQRLGLSPRRVQMMLRAGLLPGMRVGRVWLVPRAALEAHLRSMAWRAQKNVQGDCAQAQEAQSREIRRT